MNRLLLSILCLLFHLISYGMQSNEFLAIIDNYGTDDKLQEKLIAIRAESKEADFFLRKFYEKNEKEECNQSVRDNVKLAADRIGRRYYEKAIKDYTNVDYLRKALRFLGEDGGCDMDDTSEHNSREALISAAKNLLTLRERYNQAKRSIVMPPIFNLTEE